MKGTIIAVALIFAAMLAASGFGELLMILVGLIVLGVCLAGLMMVLKALAGDDSEPQYVSNFTGGGDNSDFTNVYQRNPAHGNSSPGWSWGNSWANPSNKEPDPPCRASGPVPPCPNCGPSKPKQESKGYTRTEWAESHAKPEAPKTDFFGRRTETAADRAEANFATFQAKWAGKDPSKIRREGQKKYHPDKHHGNDDYYQRMSALINGWVDGIEKGKQ